MAWVEFHYDVVQNRKTDKLASALKIPKVCAVGILAGLWSWAIEYAPDGDLTEYSASTIASAVCWDKGAGKLMDALKACGYLDVTEDDGIVIHDWIEYGGRLNEQREQTRERVARHRKKGKCNDDVTQNVTPQKRYCNGNVTLYSNSNNNSNNNSNKQSSSSSCLLPTSTEQGRDDDDAEDEDVKEAMQVFAENMSNAYVTAASANGINDWCSIAGPELVIAAIRHAAKQGKKPWSYVETIIRNWHELGLKTAADVEAYLASREQQKANVKPDKLAKEKGYSQRDNAAELNALFTAL